MNSIYRRLVLALIGGLISICAAPQASAETVLLFSRQSGSTEFTISSSDLATYGDRVTSPIQGASSFKYGGAANTPNIVAAYGSDESTWTSNYGDLSGVLYTSSPSFGDGIIKLTLTADSGFQVLLNSFDLAGWSQTDYIINSVKVFDSANLLVFNQSNVYVEGDAIGARHTSMTFSGLQSQSLRIEIDASNITTSFAAENIGLDNVSFSQSPAAVPEPTTYGAGLLAVGAFYLVRRAKRARML